MQTEARSVEKVAAGEMLAGLRVRIEAWRGSEGKTKQMPEELWREAADAARRLGVNPVSRALRLNYRVLKRRGASPEVSSPKKAVSRPQFVELAGIGPHDGVAAGGEAIVEMVAADGARLTVRLKDASATLLSVINAFRGRA